MSLHKNIAPAENHGIAAFLFANSSDRTTFSNEQNGNTVSASQIGKVARQTDNNTFWLLTNHSPIVWAQVGGGAGDVPSTRNLTAGAGLTGGGDLSADRTFNVGAHADGSIVVAADTVQVGTLATDGQHGNRGGGALHANVVAAGASGFMTGADKTKLDGIATGATNSPLSATAPVNVTKAAASAGVATEAARQDHKHDISTAPVGTIGTANAEGTATTLARSDHTHDHGAQTSGTLHAAVIAAGASGFMTGSDKTKLDGIATGATNTPLTAVAPVNITKAAAAVGVATEAARQDHKHDISTAAPTAAGLSTAAAEGSATTLARSDHTHQANTAPVNITKAAAAIGTSNEPARADHKHDITTAVVGTIGTANAEGTATSLARSDHTHDHGAQTSGTLHAVAINAGTAGFMSGADKAKLDGIAAGAVASHAALTGLAADDHTQYIKVDGTRAFSGTVSGVTPTVSTHLTTKAYVDSLVAGQEWQNSVINRVTATPPVSPAVNDRYIVASSPTGAWVGQTNNIATWNGSAWTFFTPTAGTQVWVDAEVVQVLWTGSVWQVSATPDHGTLVGLGDDDHTQYHTDARGDARYPPLARTLTAGNGLTGGGDLSANRTFNVVANADASIVVNADDIQVGILATDAQHGNRGGGGLHANVVAAGASGFMTGADKTKLDGIATGAAALTGAAPADVTKATAAVGVATAAARADHKHDISTAAPGAIGTANAEGTATSLARSDHTHDHGAQTSGTLHAAVIAAGASGFMTGADKTKLDGIAAGAVASHAALTGLAADDHTQYLNNARGDVRYPPLARTLTAGTGLTGGGDLSANRTFNVVANADGSIIANADDIQVGVLATDGQHGNRGGGALHATAVASVAGAGGSSGFLTAFDKEKLNQFKVSARCATTGNITLSGLQTVDGISVVANDRVLVKNQTTASENGIYNASSGAWTRAFDATVNTDFSSDLVVMVREGTVLDNIFFGLSNTVFPIVVGTDAINFIQLSTGPALASPLAVAATAALGTSPRAAREDHVHTVGANVVSNAMLRQSAGLSIIGRSANSTGNVADITATPASGAVLRESGSVIGWGTVDNAGLSANAVTTSKIADANVTLAKLAQSSATLNQVPVWNGSAWVAAAQTVGDVGTPLALWDFWQEAPIQQNSASANPLFLGAAISTGSSSTAIPTAVVLGYNQGGVFLRSSTTANSGYRYQTSSLVAMYFGAIAYKFRAQALWRTAFTNNTVRIGFLDTNTNADATDGAYFEIDGSGICSAKTASNATRTTHGTTTTLSLDTPYTFDIQANAGGTSIRFRVYSAQNESTVLDVSISTNIPTTSARAFGAGIVATNSTTTATDLIIIYSMGMGTVAGFEKSRIGNRSVATPAILIHEPFLYGDGDAFSVLRSSLEAGGTAFLDETSDTLHQGLAGIYMTAVGWAGVRTTLSRKTFRIPPVNNATWRHKWQFFLPALSTATNRFVTYFGLADDIPNFHTKMVALAYSDNINSGQFILRCIGAATTDTNTTLAVAANTWYWVELEITQESVKLYIDTSATGRTLRATCTTNIPTEALAVIGGNRVTAYAGPQIVILIDDFRGTFEMV